MLNGCLGLVMTERRITVLMVVGQDGSGQRVICHHSV